MCNAWQARCDKSDHCAASGRVQLFENEHGARCLEPGDVSRTSRRSSTLAEPEVLGFDSSGRGGALVHRVDDTARVDWFQIVAH